MRKPRSVAAILWAWGLLASCGGDSTGPVSGDLQVTIATVGNELDPDGYSLVVDGGDPQPVPSNGSVTISGMTVGPHTLTLEGLAGNCTLTPPGPAQITIPGSEGAAARLTVTCSRLYDFAYDLTSSVPSAIELRNVGGTARLTLLEGAGVLAWAPDGNSLAVNRFETISVLNSDGSGLRDLVSRPPLATFVLAAWSPDGRELLYELVTNSNSFARFLRRVNRDGTDDRDFEITPTPPGLECDPSWSPAGDRITLEVPGNVAAGGVYVVDQAGTNPRFLARGRTPKWSPSGESIAYVEGRSGCQFPNPFLTDAPGGVRAVSPDGSNDRALSFPEVNAHDESPSWSPDGSRLAFARNSAAPALYVVQADGSNEQKIADIPPSPVYSVSWAPDGAQIAVSTVDHTYLVRPDGAEFRIITEETTCCLAWRPPEQEGN